MRPAPRVYRFAAIFGLGTAALSASTAGQCEAWAPGGGAPPTSGDFRAVAMFDPDGPGPRSAEMVLGGDFELNLTGIPLARNLARWDGAQWIGVTSQLTSGRVNALATFDLDGAGPNPPRLIAAGFFTINAPPLTHQRIFGTDGAALIRLGEGFTGEVKCLHVFDPDGPGGEPASLYAGGFFTGSGSTPIARIARWNGAAWEQVGAGLNGNVHTLTTADLDGPGPLPPRLIAAGAFTEDGSRVAMFDGKSWIGLGGNLNTGLVASLDMFDLDAEDGAPPRLVAAGTFTGSGPTPIHGQAYFDGATWLSIAPVPTSPISRGTAISSFDPDGPGGARTPPPRGVRVLYFARFGRIDCCPGDFNQDGGVTSSDFFEFLDAFFREDPAADINNDGAVNTVDFFDFLGVFFDGC